MILERKVSAMAINSRNRISILTSVTMLLSACSLPADYAMVSSKTSFGVDVEASQGSFTLAFDRTEIVVAPVTESNAVPPVLLGYESDSGLASASSAQALATGAAAVRLASAGNAQVVSPAPSNQGADKRPLIFSSTTKVGFSVAMGFGGNGSSVNLGARRREITLIPIKAGKGCNDLTPTAGASASGSGSSQAPTVECGFPSVIATFAFESYWNKVGEPSLGLVQMFATGSAADELATKGPIKEIFPGGSTGTGSKSLGEKIKLMLSQ
jgi:hypothetical protein